METMEQVLDNQPDWRCYRAIKSSPDLKVEGTEGAACPPSGDVRHVRQLTCDSPKRGSRHYAGDRRSHRPTGSA